MSLPRPTSHSYLLRLWRPTAGTGEWRASLEEVRSGTTLGFASVERLVAFLVDQTTPEPRGVDQPLVGPIVPPADP